ncbi:ribosomal protein S18-alanine N-acetyltransferase [Actinomyces sp. B33]|uniref:ribosomal protein S18-alanine N-acetyltransferase n=1 Tax=Actinomyces sp. B33 TaxID=2942131 RepID=UPI002341EE1B|nr:ribosomal protein S18-alanine N-acetyltransferase [Actinomyces sp. B33]MDC4233619.1 ribosomal protein S18-alanine N-acetyltransferase [Actinomyces sp. B33]
MSPRPLRLRPAVESDGGIVAALEQAVFPEDPWTPAMIAEELASAVGHYTIVEAGGEPVGYAGIRVVGSQADVMTIGVAPGARGRGAGALLLDEALAWARRAGAREAFLDVRPSNTAAIGLYASRGFVEIGRRPRYFRHPVEDAAVMRLDLRGDEGDRRP